VYRRLLATAALLGAALTGMAAPAASAAPAFQPACATTASAFHCFAQFRAAPRSIAATPAGFGPADLHAAYRLPATGGDGQTIAIVDAFDNPNAEADLAVYRQQYGLPPCTTANGCFRKVNQRGDATPLPMPEPGWGVEIALDIDMVSAACPGCHILLVEGDVPSFEGLAAAVDTAVRLGATAVSNSYGADEFTGLTDFASHYEHPGVPILASSGDAGFGATSFPAVFDNVIAVGGTSLKKATNARGWTESAWAGAGSGCSAWIPKPSWQHDANCGMRTNSDVSAVADPKTGLAVYDTFGLTQPGWLVVGGTSASSPFIAGVIGLAGNGAQLDNPSYLYSHASALYDVTGGSNGYCGDDYLCTGLPGYDGPTGVGSPNGIGAF